MSKSQDLHDRVNSLVDRVNGVLATGNLEDMCLSYTITDVYRTERTFIGVRGGGGWPRAQVTLHFLHHSDVSVRYWNNGWNYTADSSNWKLSDNQITRLLAHLNIRCQGDNLNMPKQCTNLAQYILMDKDLGDSTPIYWAACFECRHIARGTPHTVYNKVTDYEALERSRKRHPEIPWTNKETVNA